MAPRPRRVVVGRRHRRPTARRGGLGLLLSPKARFDITGPGRVAVEAVLFIGVGACLWAIGLGPVAIVGVAAWAIDRIAITALSP